MLTWHPDINQPARESLLLVGGIIMCWIYMFQPTVIEEDWGQVKTIKTILLAKFEYDP
jgi:hypothetical protein